MTIILLAFVSAMAVAAEDGTDAILERLEKKLLKEEETTLSFSGEKKKPPVGESVRRLEYNGTDIHGQIPSTKDLDDLEKAIRGLEKDVEELARDVQATKQQVLDEAGLKNHVRLTTRLANDQDVAFRSLKVKMDGYLIYETPDSEGVWSVKNEIPLFQGPLKPGKHKLEYEARLVLKTPKPTPVSKDIFHRVNESYELEVTPDTREKSWVVSVEAPKTNAVTVQARLESR